MEGNRLSNISPIARSRSFYMPRSLRPVLDNVVPVASSTYFGIRKNKIGSTHFRVHKWYRIALTEYFGCSITSVMIHAEILIFGLEDGSIHMIHIGHYNDILSLGKQNLINATKIQVDTEPIIKLNVLEVDKKPCVVSSTESRIHLINFF
ncbi:hypothetical protein KQX54_020308 [Cotesia glomerata]|uniref:Uncharacterized protein n=1 Tax=Cotesia glomerata TaxID=32391 RepID=A0AAV7ITR2_COTGL|nr:hypothetical protein KQX54_020308 [Cotesia glomerata]